MSFNFIENVKVSWSFDKKFAGKDIFTLFVFTHQIVRLQQCIAAEDRVPQFVDN